MSSARTVVAVVVMLLGWIAVGFAHGPESRVKEEGVIQQGRVVVHEVSYSTQTSTPSGKAACHIYLDIYAKRGSSQNVTVELIPDPGQEAQMGGFTDPALGAGFEPACDIYPDFPSIGTFTHTSGEEVIHTTFDFGLNVHSHPDDNCAVGAGASGVVKFTVEALNGLLAARASLIQCELVN